jgi:hypothetical protein
MNNLAETQTRTTKLAAVSLPYALPILLTANTFALLALDQLGGIPSWIKSAVTLFLSF